ncbi:hypothetical protein NDU88_001986 [Pleurodeles waltl]|uniref:Uncharacterized protein n=1 Tax=Pleurodeles waltl TaxID=8319 RepID=A0AAV7SCF3_PLEWA|nr:hypothetical protein NDU88_001986 [Pleurodeles waltl]
MRNEENAASSQKSRSSRVPAVKDSCPDPSVSRLPLCCAPHSQSLSYSASPGRRSRPWKSLDTGILGVLENRLVSAPSASWRPLDIRVLSALETTSLPRPRRLGNRSAEPTGV